MNKRAGRTEEGQEAGMETKQRKGKVKPEHSKTLKRRTSSGDTKAHEDRDTKACEERYTRGHHARAEIQERENAKRRSPASGFTDVRKKAEAGPPRPGRTGLTGTIKLSGQSLRSIILALIAGVLAILRIILVVLIAGVLLIIAMVRADLAQYFLPMGFMLLAAVAQTLLAPSGT